MNPELPSSPIIRDIIAFLHEGKHYTDDLESFSGVPLCHLRRRRRSKSSLQHGYAPAVALLLRVDMIRLISTGPNIELGLVCLTQRGQAFANDMKSLKTREDLYRGLFGVQENGSSGLTRTIKEADRYTSLRVKQFIRKTLLPLGHGLDTRISKMVNLDTRDRAYKLANASNWPDYGIPFQHLYKLVAFAFPVSDIASLPSDLLKKKYPSLWNSLLAAYTKLGQAKDSIELFFACYHVPEHPTFLAALEFLLQSGAVTISEFQEILDGEESGTNGAPEPIPGPVLRMADAHPVSMCLPELLAKRDETPEIAQLTGERKANDKTGVSVEAPTTYGYRSADYLCLKFGIRKHELSRSHGKGKIDAVKAPPGTLDSQGRSVRMLYNLDQAKKYCMPKRVRKASFPSKT